jgi:hypothetical protein
VEPLAVELDDDDHLAGLHHIGAALAQGEVAADAPAEDPGADGMPAVVGGTAQDGAVRWDGYP